MDTDTYGYSKLADSQFQSGVEITPNKGAGGSTYTGTVVFYAPAYGMNISAVYPIINKIKVGGGNLFEEEAKFEFEFGTYDSSGFHPFSGWKGSFTVSEGTVYEKQCTIDGGTVHIKPTDVMAYRLKVSSNKSSRVANTTMTDFRLKFDYEFVNYTVTVNVLPEGAGTITGNKSYVEGMNAKVTAEPSNGYKFVGFGNQNVVITVTTNPYVFTVNNNTTFYAIFESNSNIYRSTRKQVFYRGNNRKQVYRGNNKVSE